MKEQKQTQLTPEQAADVIRYYETAEKVSKGERSLAEIAVIVAGKTHSILPGQEPLLTHPEASAGLEHILQRQRQERETISSWPEEPSDEEWEKIYKLNDQMPLVDAYAAVMGVWPAR